MNNFSLAILAAKPEHGEHSNLEKNLHLAIAWLDKLWQLTKPAQANFILMLVTSTKSLKTLQMLQNNYPVGRIIVATSVQIELPQIKWLITFSKTRSCPTVLSLVNLLSRIREHYQHDKPDYLAEKFVPTDYLPSLIEQCKGDGVARLCMLDNGSRLIIAPKESSYFFSGELEEIVPLAGAAASAVKVKPVSGQELADAAELVRLRTPSNHHAHTDDFALAGSGANNLTQGHLNDLTWLSVLIASRGRPLSTYTPDAKILLSDIPDILLMNYFSDDYKKLSEIFISKPASVIDASLAAQRSLFDTINFCNACTVLNMTEINPQP